MKFTRDEVGAVERYLDHELNAARNAVQRATTEEKRRRERAYVASLMLVRVRLDEIRKG